MNIIRGYVFRLYPNLEQQELIEKSFGCSRFIYNYFLNKYPNFINAYKCCNELKDLLNEYEWLKEVDSCLLRNSIFNLDNAFKRYNETIGNKPKFKSKNKSRKSYKTNNIISSYKGKTYNSIKIDLNKNIIILPKLKEIKIRGYRNLSEIKGNIKSATIYKEANKYYVSITVEDIIEVPKFIPTKIVGIDLGIKDLIVTSDGIVKENKKVIEKYEKKIKGLNRWLSRSKLGSKNKNKVKIKLGRTYQKLKNARKYLIHLISKEIVSENDIIVTEKLKIKEMVKGQLSKKIYDASWAELIRELEYKSKWRNKKFYQIDTYYPSSQICSRCGYQNKKVKDLRIRKWECPNCLNLNERDLSASINIMFEGLKLYMKNGLELQVK